MPSHPAPLVSVIIPAFRARAFIADAVQSVLSQDAAPGFEILVSPDDGEAYDELRALASPPILQLLPPAGHHGVSWARNRAVDAARGELLALCDADDRWPPNYLAAITPLALAHGAACAPTRYTDWHGRAFRIPDIGTSRLALAAFARSLASIRPVWAKRLGVRFQAIFAEDVLHTLHLVALVEGGLPITGETWYELRARTGSASESTEANERRIIAAHTETIVRACSVPDQLGLEALPASSRATIVHALEFWRFANITYLAAGGGASFMQFVAGREAALWGQFINAAAPPTAGATA
ncbi:MAG TPA: glycosyltransferase family 2 protein [Nevskiaceae bacterium]|nr:glycosyltransferase family 2 protein [Nevskiaceae bacterium]